jgi:hypothetical protein
MSQMLATKDDTHQPHPRETCHPRLVIPAEAGIQAEIPALMPFLASHPIVTGRHIRTVLKPLAQKDVNPTMSYTDMFNRGGHAVRSPVCGL